MLTSSKIEQSLETTSVWSFRLAEPCVLVMYHSMRPHPAITATLLDFMCRVSFGPSSSLVIWGEIFSLMMLCLTIFHTVAIRLVHTDHDELPPTADTTNQDGNVHFVANHPGKAGFGVREENIQSLFTKLSFHMKL